MAKSREELERDALNLWRRAHRMFECNCDRHFTETVPNRYQPVTLITPVDDLDVCVAEIAWRRYTEIRDHKPLGYYSAPFLVPRKMERFVVIDGGKK